MVINKKMKICLVVLIPMILIEGYLINGLGLLHLLQIKDMLTLAGLNLGLALSILLVDEGGAAVF